MHKLVIIFLVIVIFLKLNNKEGYDNIVYDNNYIDSLKTKIEALIKNEKSDVYLSSGNMLSDKIDVSNNATINTVSADKLKFSNNELSGNINVSSLCFTDGSEKYCIKEKSDDEISKEGTTYTEGVYHVLQPVNHKILDGSDEHDILSFNLQNILRNSSQNVYSKDTDGNLVFENAGKITFLIGSGGFDDYGKISRLNINLVQKEDLNLGSYTLTGGADKERAYISELELNPGYEVTAYSILPFLAPIWVFRNDTNSVQTMIRGEMTTQSTYESNPYLTYKKYFWDLTYGGHSQQISVHFITVKRTAIAKTD